MPVKYFFIQIQVVNDIKSDLQVLGTIQLKKVRKSLGKFRQLHNYTMNVISRPPDGLQGSTNSLGLKSDGVVPELQDPVPNSSLDERNSIHPKRINNYSSIKIPLQMFLGKHLQNCNGVSFSENVDHSLFKRLCKWPKELRGHLLLSLSVFFPSSFNHKCLFN